MKKGLILLVIAALLPAPTALTAPGDIANKIDLPFHHATGVTWNGKAFWIADRKTDTFYKLDPAEEAVIDSIRSPGYFPSGICWDGKLLWSTDPSSGKIYALDTGTGMTVKTIDSPSSSTTGIAWDGRFLWICDNRTDMISKIDPGDGTTIVSFPSPASDPRGLTFGGGYLWCSDRIKDQIYMIHPENGHTVIILDAPGPFTWGLAWKDGALFNTDYENDALYELVVKDKELYKTYEPRHAVVDFSTEAVVLGQGGIESFDIYYTVPSDRNSQKIAHPIQYLPEPSSFEKDRWGQKIAVFHFENLEPAQSVDVMMKVELEAYAIRYFIYPEDVGDEIPDKIAKRYLADETKYDIHNPYIREIVENVAGEETNIYWKARKLFQYLIANMEYKLAGGWNTAPTVLKRRNGSCSEYSFSFIALCRAAGVPARYVGSLVVRGDDASYDEVFHRWCEIYLPGFGWVPIDPNAGDRERPADQAAAFGGIANRFLITTEGGGSSEYIGWNYNADTRWISSGKCWIKIESIAEWEPLNKGD